MYNWFVKKEKLYIYIFILIAILLKKCASHRFLHTRTSTLGHWKYWFFCSYLEICFGHLFHIITEAYDNIIASSASTTDCFYFFYEMQIVK